MRHAAILVVGAFLWALPACAADVPAYDDLLAKAVQGDAPVDYTALRMAYAEWEQYDPYDSKIEEPYHALLTSVHDKDCPAVLAKSAEILKIDYLSIFTHVFRAECLESSGDNAGATREITVANGLRDSLLASGDGLALSTAYKVVTMSEEHYLLVGSGFPEEKQALLNDKGRMFDAISGHDFKTGEMRTAYFDVTALLAGMARALSPKPGDSH